MSEEKRDIYEQLGELHESICQFDEKQLERELIKFIRFNSKEMKINQFKTSIQMNMQLLLLSNTLFNFLDHIKNTEVFIAFLKLYYPKEVFHLLDLYNNLTKIILDKVGVIF